MFGGKYFAFGKLTVHNLPPQPIDDDLGHLRHAETLIAGGIGSSGTHGGALSIGIYI